MYWHLKFLIEWPSRETMNQSMPPAFNTGQKLEFPVVTYLGHFMLSPPFLWMIGLNALHYRTFSPIHYRKAIGRLALPTIEKVVKA